MRCRTACAGMKKAARLGAACIRGSTVCPGRSHELGSIRPTLCAGSDWRAGCGLMGSNGCLAGSPPRDPEVA